MQTTTTTLWQKVAIALAVVTLGLQIMIGMEHLEAASTATKASIVLVMISLAILPKLIEIAAGARMYALSGALLLAFASWLVYSLPATIGRTAEVKEVKIAEAKATGEGRKLLLAELERAQHRLQDATRDAEAKCKNPSSDNCRAARTTEGERQSRVDILLQEVIGTKAPASGDVASDLIAWALVHVGLSADAIRKISTLAFALGLDVIIWTLVWFGTTDRLRKPALVMSPAKVTINAVSLPALPSPNGGQQVTASGFSDQESLDDIRREVAAGRHHGVVEYGVRWGVSKAESSKRISSFEEMGEVVCQRYGQRKLVTGIKRRLTRAA